MVLEKIKERALVVHSGGKRVQNTRVFVCLICGFYSFVLCLSMLHCCVTGWGQEREREENQDRNYDQKNQTSDFTHDVFSFLLTAAQYSTGQLSSVYDTTCR